MTEHDDPTEVLAPGRIGADEASAAAQPTAPQPTAPYPPAAQPTAPYPTAPERPTIRWGALVWALLFAATAALTLWVLSDPARRETTALWLQRLDPIVAALYLVVALGVVVALFGIVGLIRRGERARRGARG